jgi:hypothetical protein
MKYKIQFILDKGTPTDRMRDIKLNLLEQSVDMSLISDYPIDIPNDFIYLSDINFKILKKEVRITNGFYNIEVTILDTETLDIITDQDQAKRSKSSVYKRYGVTY